MTTPDTRWRIEHALEYMRLCATGLTRGEAADVEAILLGVEGSESYVERLARTVEPREAA